MLVVTNAEGHVGTFYEGEPKREHMMNFLREFAYQKQDKKKEAVLKELTQKGYNSGDCGKSSAMCLIFFKETGGWFSGGDSTTMIDEIVQLYANDPISFFWIDSEKNKAM